MTLSNWTLNKSTHNAIYVKLNVCGSAISLSTFVTLRGYWLDEAGFETGTPLEVKVLPDSLILSVKQPSPKPEVIQTLRQLCPKLSERKQRELMAVI
ncbi:SymE family type I addiction module toxin [Pantoea stewartii]|uniref:SymE family type I addiction module toxin n=1 Tax=Pantoea stewartii TaxID=66269 RepID=UPI002DBCA9AF|nr:SymE family type I addiction module toxin [Pantoea stewartii]